MIFCSTWYRPCIKLFVFVRLYDEYERKPLPTVIVYDSVVG